MIIVFDMDGVLCENGRPEDYARAIPIQANIDKFNHYVDEGHDVIIHTSRLGEKDLDVTIQWLKKHGVKSFKVSMDKPSADLYIDDKAINFIPDHGAKVKRKKLIVCLSGGMDSYIAYWYAIKEKGYKPSEVDCIYFDIGHPYAEKEKAILPTLDIPFRIMKIDLIKPEYGNVPDETNYIIPARNMIFASIAAGFGERVWIMGMKFENHSIMYDKNDNFFRLATIALSQAVGAETIIESPFIDMSKTDTIQWALRYGLPHLSNTTSCYNPKALRCGYCSLCFKRWIAMMARGISEGDYMTPPYASKEAKRLMRAYKKALKEKDFTHYQEDRIRETLAVMKNYEKRNKI